MTDRLAELARSVGIVDEYVDQNGRRVVTTNETRVAILDAMGLDASTETHIDESIRLLREEDATCIDPVRVATIGDRSLMHLRVRAPGDRTLTGPWRLDVVSESGEVRTTEGVWRGSATLDLQIEKPLPVGYHTMRLWLDAGGDEWREEQTLIVAPARCTTPDDLIGNDRVAGVIANLYAIRGHAAGVGDLTDLATLARATGDAGGDFVGVNPLHALTNRGGDVSPYSPTSRLFKNPIYLDVNAALASLGGGQGVPDASPSPDTVLVDYEAVAETKNRLLRDAFHAAFGSGSLARDVAALVSADDDLRTFATFCALAEEETLGGAWQRWPAVLRDPKSPEVARFQVEKAERVAFHAWCQVEIARQLEAAANAGRTAGLRIGLYQDLALGSRAGGSDIWANPGLFTLRASAGAPPDQYSDDGQNWGLPVISPRAHRRNRYRYFIRLIQRAFQHAGAIRIDHVLGLFRLFWIPAGSHASRGAYVRYPEEDLLSIIALESARHRALVVGEDLGTVPPEVGPALERFGVLSSKVLLFEKDGHRFREAARYPRLALATAGTHDLPPLAGYWTSRDVTARLEAGVISADRADEMRHERANDEGSLVSMLREGNRVDGADPSRDQITRAVTAFLGDTEAALVGVSLDDVANESEPVNVPGLTDDRYPCWRRRMSTPLDEIVASGAIERAIETTGRVHRAP